ncbi:MAG: FecR domain-containing protein [Bacteroidota bacterium]
MIDRKLLDKFYEGKCTPEEVKQVLSWFESQQKGEQYIEDYWHTFEEEISATQPPPLSTRKTILPFWQRQWIRVAAILVFAFSLALLWAIYDQPPPSTPVAVQTVEKNTLAGQRIKFQLPDGSIVMLNAESQLAYPEQFNETSRKVNLTGEAFFDVAENAEQPFIVSARGVNTQALGTSFNVRAYEDEQQVEIVLATGKVKIDFAENEQTATAYLTPGEKVIADTHTQSLNKTKADLTYALGWKDNTLSFRETEASEVFSRLERWYGVDISFSKTKNDWQFTGDFQGESLENVLTSIGYAKNFQFTIKQKNVTITY